MATVAVASSSQLAADAGAAIADAGGNAVDVAIAACLTSMTTEPGVCSLGAGGYVTVWVPGTGPVTIDGYAAVPGLGLPDSRLGEAAWEVNLTYGGGVRTIVGYGSVGVPGGVAALGEASRRYGSLPWKEVVEPAMTIVETGFPLPSACHHYLESSADPVFGWEPHSRGTFIDAEGNLVGRGDTIRLPGLATTLETLAIKGPEEFYTGDLGHTIADYVSDHGGSLNRADMSAYKPIVRPSLQVSLDDWRIATNPPPAVGGATLAAMLMMMNDVQHEGWDPVSVRRLVEVQHAVIRYRHQHIDTSGEMTAAIEGLLQMARAGTPPGASGSTVHTSAADRSAIGCSITMSSGYGSGALPPGTGIWLNNCLGEIELLPGGIEQAQPGRRLPSNMAPTVARTEDGRVLSTGSPGADRITTAMLQVLVNHIHFGAPLEEAIAQPRAHVEISAGGYRVAHEPGLPVGEVDLPCRSFDEPSMYFGGVAVAEWGPASGFVIAADPRRQGGTAVGGA